MCVCVCVCVWGGGVCVCGCDLYCKQVRFSTKQKHTDYF